MLEIFTWLTRITVISIDKTLILQNFITFTPKDYVWSSLFICYHVYCPCNHLTLKEIPILQVPEEPKKIVPQKKFPVIKKAEPPPPKGTFVKINICVILCV